MTSQFYGRNYKALLWDYDYLLTKTDDECCYSLSEREVQILLAVVDYVQWTTRYKNTETVIDIDQIEKWGANIARKLMSGCCPDDEKLTRFTAEGVWEVSIDGGETWHEEPGSDPRNDATQMPPLADSGESTKCAAANNARDQFKAIRDQLIELLTAGTTVLAIIAGIMAALGVLMGISVVGTAIGVLLVGLATALLSTTPEGVEEDLSDEVMDDFRCILYCNMQPNGQFTYDDWLAVLNDVDETFTGFALTFFHGIVAAMGFIGLSNAGTIGATTADDCDECDCGGEWCYRFDFTTGEHSWEINTSPFTYGRYVASTGFMQALDFDPADAIELESPTINRTLTNIRFIFDPAFSGSNPGIYVYKDGYSTNVADDPGGASDLNIPLDSGSFTTVAFDADPYRGSQQEWTGVLIAIELRGLGTNPFGEDNCEE